MGGRPKSGQEGLPFFAIGTATPEREVLLRRSDGTATGLPGVAWRHAT